MFDFPFIKSKMYGIVGAKNPYDPAFSIIDAANQISRSGLYVTDNAFCKIRNLKETQDYADISNSDFNIMLKEMQENAIVSVVTSAFDEPDFIDRDLLYKYAANLQTSETLPIGFVGDKIEVREEGDISIEVKRVLLNFSGTGPLRLILWNTASKTAVFTKDITITSDSQEVELNWVLNNTGTRYKGEYYLGYLTTGLTVAPYRRDWENSSIMTTIKCVYVERIYVSGHNTETLFDLKNVRGMSEFHGLNFDISVFRDYTDLVVNNESMFSRAINMVFQINFLSVYAASMRHNEAKRISDNLVRVIQEIEGQSAQDGVVKVTGLRPLLIREMGLIKKEIERIKEGYFPSGIHKRTLS